MGKSVLKLRLFLVFFGIDIKGIVMVKAFQIYWEYPIGFVELLTELIGKPMWYN